MFAVPDTDIRSPTIIVLDECDNVLSWKPIHGGFETARVSITTGDVLLSVTTSHFPTSTNPFLTRTFRVEKHGVVEIEEERTEKVP